MQYIKYILEHLLQFLHFPPNLVPVAIPVLSPITDVIIPPQPLKNAVGQVTVNVFGKPTRLFLVTTSPGISVDGSGTITVNNGAQGLLAIKDVSPKSGDSNMYFKWPLSGNGKGPILSYTVDLSKVPCGW